MRLLHIHCSMYICNGVFPFRLLPFRLLPFCLLPFRLRPFCLLSIVKSVPFRLHSRFCTLPSFKGILIRPVHICTTLMGQKKAFAFDGKLSLQIQSTFYLQIWLKRQLGATIHCFCIVLYCSPIIVLNILLLFFMSD